MAIDGCSVGCAKAILEQANVPLKNYIVVTELGIEKNKDFKLKEEDIRKVKEAVKTAQEDGIPAGKNATKGSEGCC